MIAALLSHRAATACAERSLGKRNRGYALARRDLRRAADPPPPRNRLSSRPEWRDMRLPFVPTGPRPSHLSSTFVGTRLLSSTSICRLFPLLGAQSNHAYTSANPRHSRTPASVCRVRIAPRSSCRASARSVPPKNTHPPYCAISSPFPPVPRLCRCKQTTYPENRKYPPPLAIFFLSTECVHFF